MSTLRSDVQRSYPIVGDGILNFFLAELLNDVRMTVEASVVESIEAVVVFLILICQLVFQYDLSNDL